MARKITFGLVPADPSKWSPKSQQTYFVHYNVNTPTSHTIAGIARRLLCLVLKISVTHTKLYFPLIICRYILCGGLQRNYIASTAKMVIVRTGMV